MAWELSYTILNHPSSAQETRDRASQVISEAESHLDHKQVQAIKERVSGQALEEVVDTFARAKQTA